MCIFKSPKVRRPTCLVGDMWFQAVGVVMGPATPQTLGGCSADGLTARPPQQCSSCKTVASSAGTHFPEIGHTLVVARQSRKGPIAPVRGALRGPASSRAPSGVSCSPRGACVQPLPSSAQLSSPFPSASLVPRAPTLTPPGTGLPLRVCFSVK